MTGLLWARYLVIAAPVVTAGFLLWLCWRERA